jgi:DNA-binding transcriptional regulator YhcF (GntR family)
MHLVSGALSPGDAMPSVRSLAAQLGVHFNTIADAYRELAAEGWIDLAHGKRAVVLPRAKQQLDPAGSDNLRQRLRALVAELRIKGVPAKTIERDIAEVLKADTLRR